MSEPVDPNPQHGYPPPPGYQPPSPPPGYQPPSPSPGGPYWPAGPGGYPLPGGPWSPPPQPARSSARRTALIASAAAVLVAGGAVGLYFGLSGASSSPERVTAPQAFAGYTRLTNSTADRVQSSVRSLGESAGGGAAKKIFDAATIGVYAKNSGDQPVLITLALPTKATDSGESAEQISTELLQGAVTASTAYSSGSHGGVTRCGTAQFGAAAETMCAWSDAKTSGVLVSVNPPVAPAALAQVSVSYRDKIE